MPTDSQVGSVTQTENRVLTPSDLNEQHIKKIENALNYILADVFALYLKTKNFHWHISGPHFRDYHLLLDEQADELFGMTDTIAERVRKIGGLTLRSIGDIARRQRISDNDAFSVDAQNMLNELRSDNLSLLSHLRTVHDLCGQYHDIATASLIENWTDQAERRVWFLFESSRKSDASGH